MEVAGIEQLHRHMEKYADLMLRVGVNLQPNQSLMIITQVQTARFVRIVAAKAYELGARHVYIEWQDEQLEYIRCVKADDATFGEYPTWYADARVEMARQGAAFLFLESATPDLMRGIEPGKISTLANARNKIGVEFRNYTRFNKVSWCIAAVPTAAWAQKIFAEQTAERALDEFWRVIFRLNRVDCEDPVSAWTEHLQTLDAWKGYLNRKKYKRLHYRGPGTALSVALPDKHVWVAASSVNERGVRFSPNLPTEEVFTSPMKNGVSGVVSSTRPLYYQGTRIEDFSLTFAHGKVVAAKAAVGEEMLNQLMGADEGAAYLGEVALVPHRSPISDTNLVFHSTLFDENASCHLAVGMAFPFCLEGGTDMSKEQLAANGINSSMVHVDFMIGGPELHIAAETAQGEEEILFRNGNWAVPVN